MARVLLVTNAAHDNITEYLDTWSEAFIKFAKDRGDSVFELRGPQATKVEVTNIINKEKPQLLVFNGHGSDDALGGFNHEVLIKCDENEDLLKDKIIHALACDSAKGLGPKAIQIGTITYLGYKESFKLDCQAKQVKTEQLTDPYAQFFLAPAFEAILALVEGATAKEAYDRSQKKYLQVINMLILSPNTTLNSTIAADVYHNYRHQTLLGNHAAQF